MPCNAASASADRGASVPALGPRCSARANPARSTARAKAGRRDRGSAPRFRRPASASRLPAARPVRSAPGAGRSRSPPGRPRRRHAAPGRRCRHSFRQSCGSFPAQDDKSPGAQRRSDGKDGQEQDRDDRDQGAAPRMALDHRNAAHEGWREEADAEEHEDRPSLYHRYSERRLDPSGAEGENEDPSRQADGADGGMDGRQHELSADRRLARKDHGGLRSG